MRNFSEGDKVKAYVVSIDREKRKFNLSLKPSYLSPQERDDTPDDDILMSQSPSDEKGLLEDDVSSEVEDSHDTDQPVDPVSEELPSFHFDTSSKVVSKQESSRAALTLGGFQWDGGEDAASSVGTNDDSEIDDSDFVEITKRKGKKRQIVEDLTADMHTRMPESTADFERHLLSSPDSSYLWVQYMSFQIQLSEIEKAREVGRRALRIINFREEREKLNIWVALLNLETLYGTEESLDKLFKDAARHNDSKTIHLRFASILEHSGKHEVSMCCPSYYHFLLTGYNRKHEIPSRELAKNLGKVTRCGSYLRNSTCATTRRNEPGLSFLEAFKAWRNANVCIFTVYVLGLLINPSMD